MAIELRDYQDRSVLLITTAMRTYRSVLYTLPTACGKTVIAARIVANALREGQRVLFVAHRREIILQTAKKFVDDGIREEDIGVLLGEEPSLRRPDAPIQIASIQFIGRGLLKGEIDPKRLPPATMVVFDEAHRSAAPNYLAVAGQYPDATILGLTATPHRTGSKSSMRDMFDELVIGAMPSEMVAGGWLAVPRIFSKSGLTDPIRDLKAMGVTKSGADWKPSKLIEAVRGKRELVGDIVEHWKRHANGYRTVVFSVSVEHSKEIAAAFIAHGVTAAHIDGETSTGDREGVLDRLRSGAVKVVTNCEILTEGWDLPELRCCIIARPTLSLVLYLQQIGRLLRPFNGERPVILDHAGNVFLYGLPTHDWPWSLDGRLSSAKSAPMKICPNGACEAVMPAGTAVCPECGHDFEIERALRVAARPGELAEVKQRALDEIVAERRRIAMERGYLPGWAESAGDGL